MLLCQQDSLPQGIQQNVLDLIDLLRRVWASLSMPAKSQVQINPQTASKMSLIKTMILL